MPAPRKFDEETRSRAVRLYRDRLGQHGGSKVEARRQVGALLDIDPATIRNWVEAEEVRVLKPRVAELERANEILQDRVSVFRVGGARPPTAVIVTVYQRVP